MNEVLKQDLKKFVDTFPLKDELANSSILITGGTGLIGTALIRCLSALESNIKIIAPVRNIKKGRELFADYSNVKLMEGSLFELDYSQFEDVDFIIHGAAPTASRFFVEKPVETIKTIVEVTDRVLNYAKNKNIRSFVFLSSLEVYGTILEEKVITEEMRGEIDITDVRSSYPLGKQLAENLCCAYSKEFQLPVKIARLTQTTGAGIAKDDNRVIAQFVRKASIGEDIVLHTEGLSARPYCYLTDAIKGILYILLKGKDGEAYNVANPDTYISAHDLAYMVRNTINPHINIRVELKENMGYAPTTYLNLSVDKLHKLGWKASYGLLEILGSLNNYLSL